MKITGIICEYNPFHNGHLHQIQELKSTPDNYVICIMSGDWVQRGGPAIIDKYSRTQMALKSGADVVIELPVIYSTASAKDFAFGGVSLLNSLGCVDELCYGCENPDSDITTVITSLLYDNNNDIQEQIASTMKEGNSYPKAREIVLRRYLDESLIIQMNQPNNILALEYNIALKELNSSIKPHPIKRIGSDYLDKTLNNDSFSSATAIRECIINSYDFVLNDDSSIRENEIPTTSTYATLTGLAVRQAMSEPLSPIKTHVPPWAYDILLEQLGRTYPLTYINFSRELGYKLILEAKNGYDCYMDISKDLSDKIQKNLCYFKSVEQFCNHLKSKDITYARINRCLTHILLDIRKDLIDRQNGTPYARILGFKKDSEMVLSRIKENSSIPMISKLADAPKILDDKSLEILGKDIQAAHIYDMVSACKYQSDLKNEMTRQIIII